jgi:hypothetical protein
MHSSVLADENLGDWEQLRFRDEGGRRELSQPSRQTYCWYWLARGRRQAGRAGGRRVARSAYQLEFGGHRLSPMQKRRRERVRFFISGASTIYTGADGIRGA